MLQAILVAAIQYALPAIITAVVAHQKANGGATPTPAQVLEQLPPDVLTELAAIDAQGQQWKATHQA